MMYTEDVTKVVMAVLVMASLYLVYAHTNAFSGVFSELEILHLKIVKSK